MASCDKRFSFLTTEFKETLLVQLFPLLEIVLLTCLFLRALAVIFDKLPCCLNKKESKRKRRKFSRQNQKYPTNTS